MSTNIDSKLGEIIRRERKAKRLTMKELGKRVGASESTIQHYETGFRGMTIDMFFNICDVLNLDVNEIRREANGKK